ncbi:glycosyl hydrolase [Streptomyces sp. B6B3]|uniref:glycosyl hydrolase n=1 Tax=Streptomyces sp. B6B3 TaxID=3153570 RepID=UPI00325F7535
MMRRRDLLRGSLAVTTTMATTQALAGVGRAAGVPASSSSSAAPGDRLGWGPITAQTRPWTRWWWLGSAVTEDRLAWHLRAFAEAGLGGVEVQPIYEAQGLEDRILPYLSREWLDALAATTRHAADLGLGVDLTAGSGWNIGGPWITPELSAGRALVERWELTEGQRLDVPVRTEQPPHPGLIDEERLSRPDLRPPMDPLPEPPLAALVAREAGSGETIDLASRVGADGTLDWTAPPGRWELVGVFSGLALKRVERAGPGGKGLMADCFAAESVRTHLDRLDEALDDGPPGLRAMFHDSFELEATDWTREAVAEFARLRGYDLLPHLPAVFAETDGSGDSDARLRVLSDVRETFSDLFLERFARPFTDWSARRGWLTRNQAHGSPAHLLDVYAAADIPETEYTGAEIIPIPGLRQGAGTARRPTSLTWRMASSPAHTQGKPLVAAEAITWLDQHYHVALSQAKPAVDVLFAAGVNHIVLHGSAYSPEDAPWPGHSFYAATEVQPANTSLWRDLPEFTGYVTRCQSVLQSGEHDNDVLVYWPQHDLWGAPDGGVGSDDVELTPDHHWSGDPWMYGHPTGADVVAGGLEARGWQFDWVSDRQLAAFTGDASGVRNEHARYRAVVVPGARLVPLATLERLHALASAGATVVFAGDLPEDVPGLADLDERRARLVALYAPLGAAHGRNGVHRVGRGRIVVTAQGADLDEALADAGAAREPAADAGLSVLRRRHDEGRHYFLANVSAEPVDGWFPLGTRAASVAALDPLRDTGGLASTRGGDGDRQVRLRLDPGESLILRTFDDQDERRVEAPAWTTSAPTGRERPLTGPWTLTFLDGGPTLPPERTLPELVSWPELGDAEAAFSGTARYALEFDLPAADARRTWRLDLGDVRETASVRLNGRELGTAWSLPFRLPLGRALRTGRNVLELDVTNLAANRVRDLARRGELVTNFWVSWLDASPPAAWEPMPSGLLGPVRLTETSD